MTITFAPLPTFLPPTFFPPLTLADILAAAATLNAGTCKTALDMETLATKEGDLDFADEVVLPFIVNFLTDKKQDRRAGVRA
jgi:hypothetical protein